MRSQNEMKPEATVHSAHLINSIQPHASPQPTPGFNLLRRLQILSYITVRRTLAAEREISDQ